MAQGENGSKPQKGLGRLRRHPTGRIALKVGIALLGGLVVAIGILLIPLPGPGWLIVFAGLGIWAVEFHWARRLLNWGRERLRLWTFWASAQSWPVRALIGILGLLFVVLVISVSLRLTLGVNVLSVLPGR